MAESTNYPELKLYWLNNSRAQRIVWLLEELGLSYEVEIFQRNKDMFAPSELKEVHPLGKSPMVIVTIPQPSSPVKRRKLVLAESGLIAQYLADHFGKHLLPKHYCDGQEGQPGGETDEWIRYQYFLHYAEGSLHPPLLVQLILMSFNGKYLCGDHLTAADILMSYPLLEAREKAGELNPPKTEKWSEKYPKLWVYLKRLEYEPGFKRAEVKIKELDARKS
ncbi:hypothetical protein N657DRAFT_653085 [Parathielavia appendiculata]|uniref:GST N-terminal domain-containing protein n=1 Tax=Parathielavia appendiculata TaxID=2587402 RepID=A0AAN6UB64_9PEZI|nr:hypothetical protein N657DRAFT_653085 [Parathielavia appendiculata]